jgi:hypothetical protein
MTYSPANAVDITMSNELEEIVTNQTITEEETSSLTKFKSSGTENIGLVQASL